MQLGENSCLGLKNVIRQTSSSKLRFIQNTPLLCRGTVTRNNFVVMLFLFHTRARVLVVGVLVMGPRALSRERLTIVRQPASLGCEHLLFPGLHSSPLEWWR